MRIVLPIALFSFVASASAQNAQKVIEDYLRAEGGAKVLGQVQTESLAGSLTEAASGKTGSFSMIVKSPNRLYLELIAGEDRTVEAYNGMSAWRQDSPEGARTVTAQGALGVEAVSRYRNSRLVDLKKAKLSVQLQGTEKVRGRDAYHLQVLLGPGLSRDVFFDAQTHLIVRDSIAGEQFDYDNYRPVNGVALPYRIDLRRGDRVYQIAVTRAEINSAVEDSVFDFPRASGSPVPDVKSLILEVSRNQKVVEEMQKEYTCHVTAEEEKVDSKSRIASKSVKEYENFNIAGEEVRRLVAEDGKPLSDAKKKKEDERFNKEYARVTAQAAKNAADPKKREKSDAKDEAQLSDFLRAVRFTNARRERFRGQDVIAVDFGPNPDYKPKKAIESIVQKMAGVLWIDEQAHDVARAEAHFSGSAKLGAGILASIDQGTSFVFEQAKVNNEVWLPVYQEVHAAGRLLLFKLKANEIERYTDCKKFHAESKITIVQE
jgi:hypothetical protein